MVDDIQDNQNQLPITEVTAQDTAAPATTNAPPPTQIDIAPPVEKQGPQISLTNDNVQSNLTPEGMDQRASMAHYALQDQSPGVAQLRDNIQNGRENEIRQTASFNELIKQRQVGYKVIKEIAQRKGFPLTEEEQNGVMQLAQQMTGKEDDPDTVLERMWAHNYVKELVQTPSSPVKEGLQIDPAKTLAVASHAESYIAKQGVVNSVKQEFDKRYENLTWIGSGNRATGDYQTGKIGVFLQSLVPQLGSYQLHNVIQGSEDFTTSILPGQNMNEMRDFAYLLPTKEFNKVVRNAAEELWVKNPGTAMKFLEDMQNRPYHSAWVDNAMGVIDVATLYPGGRLARGTKGLADASEKVMTQAPVAVTEEFVKANEHGLFSPKDVKELLEKGTLEHAGSGPSSFRTEITINGKTTVLSGRYDPAQVAAAEKGEIPLSDLKPRAGTANPRGMASYELRKAAEAFPESGGYMPSYNPANAPVGSLEAPRGIPAQGEVTGFTTAKGSTYDLKGDTTVRTKALRDDIGHEGDQGLKPESVRTVYVDPKDVGRLAIPQDTPWKAFENKDGSLGLAIKPEGGKWGPTPESKTIPVQTTPSEGLHPVELWKPRSEFGTKTYGEMHVGNEITQLQRAEVKQANPNRFGTNTSGRNLTPSELSGVQEGAPGSMLSPKLDLDRLKAANTAVEQAQKKYDLARTDLDTLRETGGPKSIESQQVLVKTLKDDLDNTVKTRASTSYFNQDPNIVRADQGMRAYMSSAFQSMKTVPTGTGTAAKTDLQSSLSTIGKIPEAVDVGAADRLLSIVNRVDDPIKTVQNMGKDLMYVQKPNSFVDNAASSSREGVVRLQQEMLTKSIALKQAMELGARVQRLTPPDVAVALRAEKQRIINSFGPNFNNSVIDMKPEFHTDLNVHFIRTILGKTNAEGFDTAESALNTAIQSYKIPAQDAIIKQEGSTYFVHVLNPIKETDNVKNFTIPTNNKSPMSWGNLYLGEWSSKLPRSAADTSSELMRGARSVATTAPQEFRRIVKGVAKDIILKDSEKEELDKLFELSQVNMSTKGEQGKYYNQTELETMYLDRYGRLPSDNVTKAYMTYKAVGDMQYDMTSQHYFAFISRWGGKNYKFKVFGPDGAKDSDTFLAREVDKLDTSQLRDMGVLVVDEANKSQTLRWTKSDIKQNKVYQAQIKDMMDRRGYQLLQLFQPLKKPLAESTGNKGDIYYVLTNTADRRNLQLGDGMEPYREGPHVVYTSDHFAAQPIITTSAKGQPVYAKDHVFRVAGDTEAEGRMTAQKYDTARELMNAGDDAALDTHLRANLPESIEDFKALFKGPNALDPTMPIKYKRGGQNTFQNNPDLYEHFGRQYPDFKDLMDDHANPERTVNSEFMQERANQLLMQAKDFGVDVPDRFRLVTAPRIDPYSTLARSTNSAINTRYMEDLKIFSAESFIKEWGLYLKGASPESLQRNPLYYIYHGEPMEGVAGETKAQMKIMQDNLKYFIGMKTPVQASVEHFEKKMENLLTNYIEYKGGGGTLLTPTQEQAGRAINSDIAQSYLLPFIKDPVSYAKAFAYHSKFFGNVVELWTQAGQMATSIALSPVSGLQGAIFSGWLRAGMRGRLEDPAIVDHYLNMIVKSSGWNKEDAKLALQTYKDIGVGNVGAEQSIRDDFFEPKIFVSKLGSFLDKGELFFNQGDKISRETAWFTAFHEWRKANPTKEFDQFDMASISQRFQTLSTNMMRDSNSALQRGFFSIPAQFLTFNQRQAELLFSNRISGMDKFRLTAAMSTIYGLPAGIGQWEAVYDFYDDMRIKAKELGINVSDKWFQAAHEGLLGVMTHWLTGKDTDISHRWGPGPNSIGKDMVNLFTNDDSSAKTFGQILFGASGGTVQQMFQSAWPIWKNIQGHFDTENQYPMTYDDIRGLGENFSGFTAAERSYMALTTGKYFSRKGQLVTSGLDSTDAVMSFILGTTPARVPESYADSIDMNVARSAQTKQAKSMQIEFEKGFEAMRNGDATEAANRWTRGNTMGNLVDMTAAEKGAIVLKAARGQEELVDAVNRQMLLNDPRQSRQQPNLQKLKGGTR